MKRKILLSVITIFLMLFLPNSLATGKNKSYLNYFYHQNLEWSSCYTHFQCSVFKVPIDYLNPNTGTFKLKVVRAVKTNGRVPVLINPGGPGDSAINFLFSAVNYFPKAFLQKYQLVAFDQRGVGFSNPVRCLTDAEDEKLINLWIDLNTPDTISSLKKESQDVTRKCLSKVKNLIHYSTWESAADMDILRANLNLSKLNYYGASYGTQLGTDYLEQFPKNAGRLVLDGAVDPNQSTIDATLTQAIGFDREYLRFTKKYPRWNLDTVIPLLNASKINPVEKNGRKLTYPLFVTALADTLYQPQYGWPVLDSGLQSLVIDSNLSKLLAASDDYYERNNDGKFSNLIDISFIMSCDDNADRPQYSAISKNLANFKKLAPIFGENNLGSVVSCNSWPTPVHADKKYPKTTNTSPVLIIGNTNDPATPLKNAYNLSKLISNSRLLTLERDGHAGFARGSSCIDTFVTKYFSDGALPAHGTICNLDVTSA